MTSKNDSAGLEALLDLARANGVRREHEEMLRASLPSEAFARYKALEQAITRKDFLPRYSEAVKNGPLPPDDVDAYAVELGKAMNALDRARGRRSTLAKQLMKARRFVATLKERIERNEEVIAGSKQPMWDKYEALSPEGMEWIIPGSGEKGWPPKRSDKAPIDQLFPGETLPWSQALIIVIEELLGER